MPIEPQTSSFFDEENNGQKQITCEKRVHLQLASESLLCDTPCNVTDIMKDNIPRKISQHFHLSCLWTTLEYLEPIQ